MPSPTSRLRLLKQAPGSNFDSWGTQLNAGALDMADEAFGVAAIAVGADVTLDVENYLTDEARRLVLHLTGAGGFTVITPAVDKPYLVVNDCSADVTITPSGGTGVTVRAGVASWVWCDGTDGKIIDTTLDKIKTAAGDVALGGNKITGVGTATAATDAATLSNKVHEFAAPTAPLAMNGQKLTGVGAATDATDAATLSNRPEQFATPTGPLAMGGQKITNLATPTVSTDAATFGFVQSEIAAAATIELPPVTGQAGKYLSNDGTVASWANIVAGTGLLKTGTDGSDKTLAVDVASDANLRAAAANKIPDAAGLRTARSVATLTDGATITPDMNLGPNFTVTLAGNRTLANPTNQAAGQAGFIRVIQDATGSRTLSYGTNWKFSGGAPTLSTAANAVDVIAYEVIADGTILATFAGEFS